MPDPSVASLLPVAVTLVVALAARNVLVGTVGLEQIHEQEERVRGISGPQPLVDLADDLPSPLVDPPLESDPGRHFEYRTVVVITRDPLRPL